MLRCVALAALLATALPATAQTVRPFTAQTLRGELIVTQPPEVLLNRQPARLAPGARLRGADNLLLMSGAVVGQSLVVNYTLDLSGHLLQVWVLTAAEQARQPWPTTPEQAAAWAFDASAQSWSRP
ncbi:MAG: hypothetical protein C0505_19470 [Leptothrix sp. (in: Bacteria)]|nr:hypothetical protein [Leptothrix sp. (in: b-proteobacteria)]